MKSMKVVKSKISGEVPITSDPAYQNDLFRVPSDPMNRLQKRMAHTAVPASRTPWGWQDVGEKVFFSNFRMGDNWRRLDHLL